MQPDASELVRVLELTTPLVGFYDAPEADPFAPLVAPKPGGHVCMFAFYKKWLDGATLHLTRDNFGCGGAGYWCWCVETAPREEFVEFLVGEEGLKSSHELMNAWLDSERPYSAVHSNILIGPLKDTQYEHLRTVTFLVDPDQLSLLVLGANYDHAPGDPPPVVASYGSGCMEIAPLFSDLTVPQAMIGATDIAMRQYLPPDILAFTVTKPMFERLCALDERSFLHKRFWADLKKARKARRS